MIRFTIRFERHGRARHGFVIRSSLVLQRFEARFDRGNDDFVSTLDPYVHFDFKCYQFVIRITYIYTSLNSCSKFKKIVAEF